MRQWDLLTITFVALLAGVALGQTAGPQSPSLCTSGLGAFPYSPWDFGFTRDIGKIIRLQKDSGRHDGKEAQAEEVELSKGTVSAYVVSGSVVTFSANVGEQGRDDILKATLFAQQAASQKDLRQDI